MYFAQCDAHGGGYSASVRHDDKRVKVTGAVASNAGSIPCPGKLCRNHKDAPAQKNFGYPVRYLAALFTLLLVDHYCIVSDEARQSVFY